MAGRVEAVKTEERISLQARSLWGKSDGAMGRGWLPLYVHLLDAFGVAERLWDEWVPDGTREVVARALGGDAAGARSMFCLLAGLHDIGKATPSFQVKPCGYVPGEGEVSLAWKPRKAGLPLREDLGSKPTHAVAGQAILEDYLHKAWGWGFDEARALAAVVGGHHGKPPAQVDVRSAHADCAWEMGTHESYGSAWTVVQRELMELVLRRCGFDTGAALEPRLLPAQAASILTGLVIMADWIASNQNLFSLIPLTGDWDEDVCDPDWEPFYETRPLDIDGAIQWEEMARRGSRAWERLGLLPSWRPVWEPADADELFRTQFALPEGARLRPMQRAAVEIARTVDSPGLMVVEAPMGEGKTEAALAAAEILARRTGRGGICVALPTMATTDAMFGRVRAWLERLPHEEDRADRSVYLAHGKAQLNEEFQGIVRASFNMRPGSVGEASGKERLEALKTGRIPETDEGVVVSEWFQGRKKGVLANFLVCTVDQVLMSALGMKHLALRQLALVNKVVIVDECHAYDEYMQRYLKRALEWLGSMRSPVVLLSATLPTELRDDLVGAYQNGWRASCPGFDGSDGRHRPLRVAARRRRGGAVRAVEEGAVFLEAAANADGLAQSEPYPLLTYTSGAKVLRAAPEPSGRALNVSIGMAPDGDDELARFLREALLGGGCAGVVCDTVTRAQRLACVLAETFPSDQVVLAHSRFTDIDRMGNEELLRRLLGPRATRENGGRPERMVVVGTQVLEQSLDIDFDVMVTDIAPVDLVMQRVGRLHRHTRGAGESQRPTGLRTARCYVRGVEGWDGGVPRIARGIERVYPRATLLEALAVLGLTDGASEGVLELPSDIARLVRRAYAKEVREHIPVAWQEDYDGAVVKRDEERCQKYRRAGACLIPSVADMVRDGGCLVDWYTLRSIAGTPAAVGDEDRGQRAVRDTQETVEVLLFELRDGRVYLLPWIGDENHGVARGAEVPIDGVPSAAVARVAAQSAVRLPLSMCPPERLDGLIGELEDACGRYVGAWQESEWLAGRLALLLEREGGESGAFTTAVYGHRVRYTRACGLEAERLGETA